MNRDTRIIIDSLHGLAWLGTVSVIIAETGSHGELQIGGAAGPILRPLTFSKRSRVLMRLGSQATRDDTAAAVLQAATVQPGIADRAVQEILALYMAGADQDAPSFVETTLLLARGAGWGAAQLADAEAAEVDRLAIYLAEFEREPEWNSLLLMGVPTDEGDVTNTLAAIRDELVDNLVKRSVPPRPGAERAADQSGNVSVESSAAAGSYISKNGASLPAANADLPVFRFRRSLTSNGVGTQPGSNPTNNDRVNPAFISLSDSPYSNSDWERKNDQPLVPHDTHVGTQHISPLRRSASAPHKVNQHYSYAFAEVLASDLAVASQPTTDEHEHAGDSAVAYGETRFAAEAELRAESHMLAFDNDWMELADVLAALLEDEADLRGIAR